MRLLNKKLIHSYASSAHARICLSARSCLFTGILSLLNLTIMGLTIISLPSFGFYEVTLVGNAFDLETNTLVYRETHNTQCSEQGEPIWGTVRYADTEGNVFAEKSLGFNHSAYSPSFVLKDFRDQYQQQVEVQQNSIAVALQQNDQVLSPETTLAFPEIPFVVDAGFNHFIRTQWDVLMAGQPVEFDFLSVTRQAFYTFEISKTPTAKTSENTHHLSLTMQPSQWWLALLVDPILLEYDKASKSLRLYQGLTNIRKHAHPDEAADDQEYFVARIEYNQGSAGC